MVTAPKQDERYNPIVGLEYAKRCVELDPQLNYINTLAEAYYVNGQYDQALEVCNKALKDHPDEKMFLERKKRYEKVVGY